MLQTFPCPSCGSTISYEGGSAPTVVCQFCGKTVPVPRSLRGAAPADTGSGRNSSTAIIIAGLAMLVAAAGAFVFLLAANSASRSAEFIPPTTPAPPNSGDADATRGAVAQATLDAEATQARAATRTAAAATAELSALATGMASTQAAWPVSLADSFQNNRAGWFVGRDADAFLSLDMELLDSRYMWQVDAKQGNAYWNVIPDAAPALTDFYASVNVLFGEGGEAGGYAYGLVFRHVNDDYGFFGIQNDYVFRVLVVYDTGIYEHNISTSAAIHAEPGQVNRLAVRALGTDFILVINDEVVWQLSEDFKPGQVGLGVDVLTTAGPARVTFDNFEVRAP